MPCKYKKFKRKVSSAYKGTKSVVKPVVRDVKTTFKVVRRNLGLKKEKKLKKRWATPKEFTNSMFG